MPHSFSYAVPMNLEHSIKEGSHERYPDHLQCFRNIKKIKYPDFQAMTYVLFPLINSFMEYNICNFWEGLPKPSLDKKLGNSPQHIVCMEKKH